MRHTKTQVRNLLGAMAHDPVRNYIVPGLDSYLIADGDEDNGKVRMFRSSRQYASDITPHSHRFDFTCFVTQGHVINRIYRPSGVETGDLFVARTLEYEGNMGEFRVVADDKPFPYEFEDTKFHEGQWYGMTSNEIHSIYFSKGAEVLFFEGPTITTHSDILLPFVGGELIDTMDCSSKWMYRRGE